MLFHRRVEATSRLGPAPQRAQSAPEYRVDFLRVLFALGFIALFIGAAFVGRSLHWPEAANAFLHLVEVSAGGLVGMFLGERATLAQLGKNA